METILPIMNQHSEIETCVEVRGLPFQPFSAAPMANERKRHGLKCPAVILGKEGKNEPFITIRK